MLNLCKICYSRQAVFFPGLRKRDSVENFLIYLHFHQLNY